MNDTRILNIWKKSGYKIPKIFYIYYDNEYMAVLDDDHSIIRFISSKGKIYLAYRKNCNLNKDYYFCDSILPIACKPQGKKDVFVFTNITPLLNN